MVLIVIMTDGLGHFDWALDMATFVHEIQMAMGLRYL